MEKYGKMRYSPDQQIWLSSINSTAKMYTHHSNGPPFEHNNICKNSTHQKKTQKPQQPDACMSYCPLASAG